MNDTTDKKNTVPQFLKGDSDAAAFYGYTCIGGRPEDQDCLAYDNVNGREVFVVCDGMGGHAGGCVASEIAARALTESLRRQAEVVPTKEAMATAVNEANSAVYKKSQEEPSLRGMGTTLTLLVIDNTAAYVTHVGDSRIYQLRKGRKIYRTFDHSMVFEQLFKQRKKSRKYRILHPLGTPPKSPGGIYTEEDARVHPRANILSKAIGILSDVEFVVTKLDYRANDRFVLCCDGVWNSQPETDVINMFTGNSDLETTVHSTRSLVEKIGKENGGNHDNHTMIVVDMKKNSKYRKSIFSWIRNLFRSKV